MSPAMTAKTEHELPEKRHEKHAEVLLIFTRTMHNISKHEYPLYVQSRRSGEIGHKNHSRRRRFLGVTFERRDTFPAALFISPKTPLLQMVGREEGREP